MREAVVSFKNFSFKYKHQKEATLHDINLDIYRGEKILILGPSGCGKSTLANCINGLIPFSYPGTITGSLTVAGLQTQNSSLFELSKHVGTVQQDSDAQFVGLSVGEDIAFSLENQSMPRSEMLPIVDEAARIVDMEKFLTHPPFDLSGGQKQKVALAGILHDAEEILLFDEPLASLDPAMGMTAVDLIDKIHRESGKTIIIIEHRLEDVLYRHVDRILLINDGRIVKDCTPDEMLCSGQLKTHGIREPLYIAALENAGIRFAEGEHLDDIEKIDIDRYRDAVLSEFARSKPYTVGEKGKVVVEVENVDFQYNPEHKVLENVSLTIREGEKLAIVGKNGAGKSTLAKLLCGIIRPISGTIRINGENYLSMSIREIGQLIGYVMQNPNQMLVKDMIMDEITLALQLNEFPEELISQRAEETLKMTGLYPMRNWPVSALSYGQKKRVTIASILALQPDVIILDEPTAGQDYRHYTEIMRFLDDLNRNYGKTIVFITHDMHLAIEYTDRALVFADGRLIADDFVYKVLSDKDIIERANLKETSLVLLARKVGLDPEEFIRHFIEREREERENG
ncbi:MAG: ABC transporter ATP-binding protein [Erysipelotrichaceae bacterium]|nr:ABC transporter ATP-binding protein [Erysipelotrichaceae bacterium]